MSHQPNPYQPPTEARVAATVAQADWANQPDGEIRFDVALTEDDVRRLYRSRVPTGPLILISLALVLLLMMDGFPLALVVLLVVLIALTMFVRSRTNWKTAIRQSPRLLLPMAGTITARGMQISGHGFQGYHRWDDFHAITTTKQCVLVAGENWRLVSLIIPWDSFSDPAAAREALESVSQQRKSNKSIPLGDPRLLEEPDDPPLFQPSESHIHFDGVITYRQVSGSEPGKKVGRITRRIIPLIVITLIVAAATILGGAMFAVFFGVPILIFGVLLIVMLIKHPLVGRREDQPIFRLRGWFSETGFFLQSVTGQSLRQWQSLQKQWHDEDMLCISLPGTNEGWFFFSRTQFASDDDFRQACQWAASGLPAMNV